MNTCATATGGPSIALVVAVYQHPEFLELIFASLEHQSHTDFEVVIADDGSGPAIADVVRRWQGHFRHPIVHVWHEKRGFRKTIITNRAVTATSGTYLVFIDGDCILHRSFLERHYRRRCPGQALSGRRVMLDAAITARLTLEDVRTRRIERPGFWWRHVAPHDRRNGFYAPCLFGWRGGFSDRYEILGCNLSLFRDDFECVNGYDARIEGRGLEDENLRARLLNAGLVVHSIAQEALQYHCHHPRGERPHDAAAVARWTCTKERWTPYGLVKEEPPRG